MTHFTIFLFTITIDSYWVCRVFVMNLIILQFKVFIQKKKDRNGPARKLKAHISKILFPQCKMKRFLIQVRIVRQIAYEYIHLKPLLQFSRIMVLRVQISTFKFQTAFQRLPKFICISVTFYPIQIFYLKFYVTK